MIIKNLTKFDQHLLSKSVVPLQILISLDNMELNFGDRVEINKDMEPNRSFKAF